MFLKRNHDMGTPSRAPFCSLISSYPSCERNMNIVSTRTLILPRQCLLLSRFRGRNFDFLVQYTAAKIVISPYCNCRKLDNQLTSFSFSEVLRTQVLNVAGLRLEQVGY